MHAGGFIIAPSRAPPATPARLGVVTLKVAAPPNTPANVTPALLTRMHGLESPDRT